MMQQNFKMTDKMLMLLCILIISTLTSTAEVNWKSSQRNSKRTVADPVSNLFSELGDLIMDMDRSFTIQTAPQTEYKDNIMAEIYRPSNDYFKAVQENYRTLQNRLGKIIRENIGPKSVYRDRDLSTVGPIILDGALISEVNTNQNKFSGPLTRKRDSDTDSDCSKERLSNPFIDSNTREECSRRRKLQIDPEYRRKEPVETQRDEMKRINDLFTPEMEVLAGTLNDFSKRDGDVVSDTKPEGRIIGDVLYSESSFDKYVRQLLRDHGKWVLDNPLLSRWRKTPETRLKDASTTVGTEAITDTSTEETQATTEESSSDFDFDVESTQANIIPSNEDEEPTKSQFSLRGRLPLRSANYYKILDEEDDDDGIVEEEINIVLSPRSDRKIADTMETADELKETVILAFTPDGVPLRLRMGPEIKNPIRFLQTVLKSAGVALNIAVESYGDETPVGKDVMKFGAGAPPRAVYLDLSKGDELKSLLKTLMKSKASEKNSNF